MITLCVAAAVNTPTMVMCCSSTRRLLAHAAGQRPHHLDNCTEGPLQMAAQHLGRRICEPSAAHLVVMVAGPRIAAAPLVHIFSRRLPHALHGFIKGDTLLCTELAWCISVTHGHSSVCRHSSPAVRQSALRYTTYLPRTWSSLPSSWPASRLDSASAPWEACCLGPVPKGDSVVLPGLPSLSTSSYPACHQPR